MLLKNFRILVTGGAGFIGSHLCKKLIKLENYVICYDNLDDYYQGKEKNIKPLLNNPWFKFVKADLLDYNLLSSAMHNVDIVFHLAAQPGVRYSMENPEKTLRVNVLGTLNVLKAARNAGVKRIIFASSSSVYGTPKYMPVDESHPTVPISIYGASKLAAEKLCGVFNDQIGLPVVILRYYTVYGPRQRPDMAIYRWTRAIFEGKPLTIYGNGHQTRDFTYIDDIINGTIRAAETEEIEGEIFNLGAGSRISVNEVVNLLVELTNVNNVEIVHETPKLGDVYDTHANITKAKKLLGFNPRVRIKDGLNRFVEWYKKDKLGFRNQSNE